MLLLALVVALAAAQSCSTSNLVAQEQVVVYAMGLNCSSSLTCSYGPDGNCHVFSARGTFKFGPSALTAVSFSQLKFIVGDFIAVGSSLSSVSFPALQQINGNVVLTDNAGLTSLSFGGPGQVTGDFRISGASAGSVVIDGLQSVSGLFYVGLPYVTSLNITTLAVVGAATFNNNVRLCNLLAPSLQHVLGSFLITGNTNIGNSWTFSSVTHIAGSLIIANNSYCTVSNTQSSIFFPALQMIDLGLQIASNTYLYQVGLNVLNSLCSSGNGVGIALQTPGTSYVLCPNLLVTHGCGFFPSVPVQSSCASRPQKLKKATITKH